MLGRVLGAVSCVAALLAAPAPAATQRADAFRWEGELTRLLRARELDATGHCRVAVLEDALSRPVSVEHARHYGELASGVARNECALLAARAYAETGDRDAALTAARSVASATLGPGRRARVERLIADIESGAITRREAPATTPEAPATTREAPAATPEAPATTREAPVSTPETSTPPSATPPATPPVRGPTPPSDLPAPSQPPDASRVPEGRCSLPRVRRRADLLHADDVFRLDVVERNLGPSRFCVEHVNQLLTPPRCTMTTPRGVATVLEVGDVELGVALDPADGERAILVSVGTRTVRCERPTASRAPAVFDAGLVRAGADRVIVIVETPYVADGSSRDEDAVHWVFDTSLGFLGVFGPHVQTAPALRVHGRRVYVDGDHLLTSNDPPARPTRMRPAPDVQRAP